MADQYSQLQMEREVFENDKEVGLFWDEFKKERRQSWARKEMERQATQCQHTEMKTESENPTLELTESMWHGYGRHAPLFSPALAPPLPSYTGSGSHGTATIYPPIIHSYNFSELRNSALDSNSSYAMYGYPFMAQYHRNSTNEQAIYPNSSSGFDPLHFSGPCPAAAPTPEECSGSAPSSCHLADEYDNLQYAGQITPGHDASLTSPHVEFLDPTTSSLATVCKWEDHYYLQ